MTSHVISGFRDPRMPPTEDEIAECAKVTLVALERMLTSQSRRSGISMMIGKSNSLDSSNIVTYNPSPDTPNLVFHQRTIQIVADQVDPLEPAKHKQKKVPKASVQEDAPPVLHDPPKKLTMADQLMWKIPPCVSNWKNTKGYVIPLDKRLAVDGRLAAEPVVVNDKFASFAESMYSVEKKASEELQMRKELRKALFQQDKDRKDQELRAIASNERMKRVRDDDDDEEMEERNKLRNEVRRDYERDMRIDNMKGKLRQSKSKRDEDRDVSESIALGLHKASSSNSSSATIFDSRLFNQSAGLGRASGDDEDESLYSKPLLSQVNSSIYKPTIAGGNDNSDNHHHRKPVEFERK